MPRTNSNCDSRKQHNLLSVLHCVEKLKDSDRALANGNAATKDAAEKQLRFFCYEMARNVMLMVESVESGTYLSLKDGNGRE